MTLEAMPEAPASQPIWKERAQQRSLASARQRADEQLMRLVRAAQELIGTGQDATIPAIVARAGMSTKTFYRHFASRDELLFAVLEEELSIGARSINRALATADDPVDRLRIYIEAYLKLPSGYASSEARRVRIQENQRLRAVDAGRAAEANAGLHDALLAIVSALVPADRVGAIEPALMTRSILHVLSGHLVDLAFAEESDAHADVVEHALGVCFGMLGLAPTAPAESGEIRAPRAVEQIEPRPCLRVTE
jgi:TetR/AcrR family transcriptional regulator